MWQPLLHTVVVVAVFRLPKQELEWRMLQGSESRVDHTQVVASVVAVHTLVQLLLAVGKRREIRLQVQELLQAVKRH